MTVLLTVVFVFLDMIALTVLYCLVFIYIRVQIKKFPSVGTTSTHQTHQSSAHELERWQVDLEALPPPSRGLPPDAITTTKVVSITTMDRRPSALPSLMSSRTAVDSHFARKRMLQVARSLLWYPFIYLCLTTPITIGRLGTFAKGSWAPAVIFVGAAIYSCAGWCNVLLYTATRKGIISWTWCGWKRKVRVPKSPFMLNRDRMPIPSQPPLISSSKESEPSTSRSSSLNPTPSLEPPIPPPKDKSDYFGLGRVLTGNRTPEPPPFCNDPNCSQRNMVERYKSGPYRL